MLSRMRFVERYSKDIFENIRRHANMYDDAWRSGQFCAARFLAFYMLETLPVENLTGVYDKIKSSILNQPETLPHDPLFDFLSPTESSEILLWRLLNNK